MFVSFISAWMHLHCWWLSSLSLVGLCSSIPQLIEYPNFLCTPTVRTPQLIFFKNFSLWVEPCILIAYWKKKSFVGTPQPHLTSQLSFKLKTQTSGVIFHNLILGIVLFQDVYWHVRSNPKEAVRVVTLIPLHTCTYTHTSTLPLPK